MVQVQLAGGRKLEPFNVQLFEAKAGDPKVPQGKPFAVLATTELGLGEASQVTREPPASCCQNCVCCLQRTQCTALHEDISLPVWCLP